MISPVSVRAAGSFASGVSVIGVVGVSIVVVASVIYLFLYVGFFHHQDKVVGTMSDYVVVDVQAYVTLTFGVRFTQGIAGEWVREDMTSFEETPEICSTSLNSHCCDDEVNPVLLSKLGSFFIASDFLGL